MKMSLILEYIKTLGTTKLILATSGVALATASFGVGENIGYDRGRLSSGSESRYEMRLDDASNGAVGMGLIKKGFDPHGVAGKIVSIAENEMIVADRDGLEKVVAVNKETLYRQARQNIELQNLSVGDFVVVLGSPDKTTGSEIDAKLVRVMPTTTPEGKPIVLWEEPRHRGGRIETKEKNEDRVIKIEDTEVEHIVEIRNDDSGRSERVKIEDDSNKQEDKKTNKK